MAAPFAPTRSSAPARLVIAGATGSVGRRCVYFAVKNEVVASVTALMRSGPAKDAAFFGLQDDDAEFAKLDQKIVDFSSASTLSDALLSSSSSSTEITAGISCLGVYTADVKGFDDFMAKEHATNLAIATAAAQAGAKRWAYLSGQGVKQPSLQSSSPSFFQPTFAFVKGSVERDLAVVKGLEATTSVRPGMILGRARKMGGVGGWIESVGNKHVKRLEGTSFAVHTDDIAKAMVQSVIREGSGSAAMQVADDAPRLNEILENQDIKRRAREYDTTCPVTN